MSLTDVFKKIIIKNNDEKKISYETLYYSDEFFQISEALHKHLNIDLFNSGKEQHVFEILIDKIVYKCEISLLITSKTILLCMICKLNYLYELPKFNPIEELKRRQGISNHKFKRIFP